MKLKLEDEVSSYFKKAVRGVKHSYDFMYKLSPHLTNYLSSAIGTVGGDALAKQFTDNPNVTTRDVIFTGAAAVVYSYLAPKLIVVSTKLTDKASKKIKSLKESKLKHTLFNTGLLTALYFPINQVYWNVLTIKNNAEISLDDNLLGAATIGLATLPYFVADYYAITKFSQPDTVKWLRPFYSGVEILWNSLFAGGNYLVKRN